MVWFDSMIRDVVCVLLPTLDEGQTIGKVIDDIPTGLLKSKGYDVDVVVVDGNSTDGTREIAKAKGVRLITQDGVGKGNALRSAFREFDGAYLFMMDADHTYPPKHILRMLPLLESEEYDVILGSRLKGYISPGAMSRVNLLGNKLLTSTANFLFPNGYKISDVCTGMWGFRGEVVNQLHLTSKGFEVEAEMFAKCVKSGLKIGEVPVEYRKRVAPAKLESLKDGIRIWLKLLREKFQR